jgi:hypothetical protein
MMSAMQAAPIDPRTTRWEIVEPAYRVYFWEPTSEDPDAMWASDEWRLTETDIHEVLAWADTHGRGRRVTSWIEVDRDGEAGLIRLSGWEPTRADAPPAWTLP